jgi:hypothetical protein
MRRVEKLVAMLRSRYAGLVLRLRDRLDAHAEHQKTGWGSSMEYKRRYTNPDDAKRQRTPSDYDRRQ